MTEQNTLIPKALGNIAWGNLLILLDVNLGRLDVLPNWVGYLLILYAIGWLAGELRDLPLLRPFCTLLLLAELADWVAVFLTGEALTGRLFLVNALLVCVSLYFHFQLLTDLAGLAGRREESGPLARRLLGCRNVEAVTRVLALLLAWLPGPEGLLTALAALLVITGLVVCIIIAHDLFALRRFFPEAAPSQP